jgi:hypothetical protein
MGTIGSERPGHPGGIHCGLAALRTSAPAFLHASVATASTLNMFTGFARLYATSTASISACRLAHASAASAGRGIRAIGTNGASRATRHAASCSSPDRHDGPSAAHIHSSAPGSVREVAEDQRHMGTPTEAPDLGVESPPWSGRVALGELREETSLHLDVVAARRPSPQGGVGLLRERDPLVARHVVHGEARRHQPRLYRGSFITFARSREILSTMSFGTPLVTTDAAPALARKARVALLGHRRHVGQLARALLAGRGERAQLPDLMCGRFGPMPSTESWIWSPEEVLHRLRAALVKHALDVHGPPPA